MKRFVKNLGIITLVICLMTGVFLPLKPEAAKKNYLTGITLDVCNRYYSVKEIKKYVDLVAKGKQGYLQLHFTGDENVGIECLYLKQQAKKQKKGAYYNPKTGNRFLSRQEIKTILKYAKEKKVKIVPEIDMPGHMGGFYTLYVAAYGKKKAEKIFNRDYDWELRIDKKEGINFAKKIYGEYASLFQECKYFHMGCDEFWSGSATKNRKYMNTISYYLEKKGFCVWAWNDLFEKKNMKSINHKIKVCYWSWDGDSEKEEESEARKKVRATFPQLQKEGFGVLNYNSYYLYFCPTKTNVTKEDAAYMKKDAKKNWSLLTWNGDSGDKAKNKKNILGACVSIWGEDSKGVKTGKIFDTVKPLFATVRKYLLLVS